MRKFFKVLLIIGIITVFFGGDSILVDLIRAIDPIHPDV